MDETQAPNIQNDFFNQARREKARVLVLLTSGRRLSGRIKSFDKFTILLDTTQGDQIIFKHAIATVGPDASGGQGRPRAGFSNRMDLEAVKAGGRPRGEPAAGAGGSSGEEEEPGGHTE